MSTKTKFNMGLLDVGFAPISAESDNALPTYSSQESLGHAVRAALTVNAADVKVYGDDVPLMTIDSFISGQIETQTLMTDLELEKKLYGGTYSSEAGLTRSADDVGTPGAVYGIRKMMKKDKSLVYRAFVLFRCTANRGSSGWDADTKGETVTPKNASVTFDVAPCNTGAWIWEQDYTSESAAVAAITTKLGISSSSSSTT